MDKHPQITKAIKALRVYTLPKNLLHKARLHTGARGHPLNRGTLIAYIRHQYSNYDKVRTKYKKHVPPELYWLLVHACKRVVVAMILQVLEDQGIDIDNI